MFPPPTLKWMLSFSLSIIVSYAYKYNAESVTQLAQADTQVIRLVVSEADKKLRCELADGGLH